MKNFILTLLVFATLPFGDKSDWTTSLKIGAPSRTAQAPTVRLAAAVTSNADWLYRIEVERSSAGRKCPADDEILLDLDDDPATGVNYASQGLGVDLLINLATRQAIRYTNGSGIESFNEIGMRAAPTYSGNEFELAFDRELTQVAGDGVRVKWYDNADQVGFPEAGLQHTLLDAPDSFVPVSIANRRNAQPGRLLERQQSDG